MKKQLVLTTAMAAALVGAYALGAHNGGDDEPRAAADTAICVDREGKRVEDYRCNEGSYGGGGGGSGVGNAFLWYYLGRSAAIPYYGDSINDRRYQGFGSYSPRQGVSYQRAPSFTAMTRSAAVSRGGLGSSGRFFGGVRA